MMSMASYQIPEKCPLCKKSKCINRVYEIDDNAKTGEFTTVGHLADKNAEKLGMSGRAKMLEKHTAYIKNRPQVEGIRVRNKNNE